MLCSGLSLSCQVQTKNPTQLQQNHKIYTPLIYQAMQESTRCCYHHHLYEIQITAMLSVPQNALKRAYSGFYWRSRTKFDENANLPHLTRLILTVLLGLNGHAHKWSTEYQRASTCTEVSGLLLLEKKKIFVMPNDNSDDRFAVALTRNNTILNGWSRTSIVLVFVYSVFLTKGGRSMCEITGTKQYSRDLPQASMEVPVYVFSW